MSGRTIAYLVTGPRQGSSISITVDASTGRAEGFDYPDRLFEVRRNGPSTGGRFATVAEARQFALGLASRLYQSRTLTVTSFERKGGEWKLKAEHVVQRHGYAFVDQSFTLSLSLDARDGTLLLYGEKYTIPDVEAPPAQPITKASAYQIATGRPLPSGAVIDAKLGYAQPRNGTGPAVLCWRLHFPNRGLSGSVTYYVDARRSTVIKTSIKK